jgi:hypothetical protein
MLIQLAGMTYMWYLGRTVAQAVSRRLPTAAVQVRSRGESCGTGGGQSGTGAGFLRLFRVPLPVINPTNCSTIITIYLPDLVQ